MHRACRCGPYLPFESATFFILQKRDFFSLRLRNYFTFVSGRSRCANFPVCFRLHRFNFFNEVKYKWKWVTEHIITLYVEASHSFTVRVQTCPNVRWEHSRLVSISIYYATYRRSEIYHYSERLETSKTHFCICIYLSKTLTTAELEYIWLIQDLSMTFSGHR